MYQRIILRLPYRLITQAMEDVFHETASEASIVNFVESFAEYYRRTESMLVQRLGESSFVHVDETGLSPNFSTKKIKRLSFRGITATANSS